MGDVQFLPGYCLLLPDPVVASPLGVALRAFFGEGGRRAWVVRTGDPSALYETAVGRFAACFPQAGQGHELDDDTDRCPQLPGVRRVYASDANFLLVRFTDAEAVNAFLIERGIATSQIIDEIRSVI